MRRTGVSLSISVFFILLVTSCYFFTSGYNNLRYAHISPYLTDTQELPDNGTGFTAAAAAGYLYVLGEVDETPVLFRTAEEEWSWESFSIPDSVFDLDSVWDGTDYSGSLFGYAFQNAAGNIVFMDDSSNTVFEFNGTSVLEKEVDSGYSFSFGGEDYRMSANSDGISITDVASFTDVVADLPADSGYTFSDYSIFAGSDGTSLFILSWIETENIFSADYSDLKLLVLPLDSMASWPSLEYPYGGEDVLFESYIGMKGVSTFSIGLDRIWTRSWDTSYFFSTSGELLIDASTAGIDNNCAFSQTTGKLYFVNGSEVYEYTLP